MTSVAGKSLCYICNGLELDSNGKILSFDLISTGGLRTAANAGCQPCQIISQGIDKFVNRSDESAVRLNWTNDHRATLVVRSWENPQASPSRRIWQDARAVQLEFFTRPGKDAYSSKYGCILRILTCGLIGKPAPWRAFATRNHPPEDSASEACFEKIKKWIHLCIDGHSRCKQPDSPPLPTRVIDVGPADGSEEPKLVETRGSCGRYLALSHCWGKVQPLKTTTANLDERMREIPWASIPKTFQDAITVARRLNTQYIWIDSLCIIQDDPSDWEAEAANMATIYENSFLTVSASLASGANQGCFSLREQPHEIYKQDSNGQSFTILVRSVLSHDNLSASGIGRLLSSNIPLLNRAWCYQERLLATRILHFLPQELVWECKAAIYCECGTYMPRKRYSKWGYARIIERNGFDVTNKEPSAYSVIVSRLWPKIVHEYSGRSLTFRKDRLPALSGIAKRLQESTKESRYLAGLWSNHLPGALLWEIGKNFDGSQPVGRRDYHAARTPSWSWASIEGEGIYINYPGERLKESSITVLDTQIVPAGIDPTGLVKEGHITLRGLVVPATLSYAVDESSRGRQMRYRLDRVGLTLIFLPDTPLSDAEDFIPTGETLHCLRFGSFRDLEIGGLVLRPSRYIPGSYERVGVIRFMDRSCVHSQALRWFEGAEGRDMRLV